MYLIFINIRGLICSLSVCTDWIPNRNHTFNHKISIEFDNRKGSNMTCYKYSQRKMRRNWFSEASAGTTREKPAPSFPHRYLFSLRIFSISILFPTRPGRIGLPSQDGSGSAWQRVGSRRSKKWEFFFYNMYFQYV